MKPGDICRLVGLVQRPERNGTYVEIATMLHETSVPEADGVVRTAMRYGFYDLLDSDVSGYIRPENLQLEKSIDDPDYAPMRRALFIHLTGWEEPE